jgi:hypothetical protein
VIISIARRGQTIGQHSEQDVSRLIASGQILPSDDYWHEGMDEWRKVVERWPVAPLLPPLTAPVVRLDDTMAPHHSGFGVVFWLIIALIIAGGACWYFFLRPWPEEVAAVEQPLEEIAEQTTTAAPVEEPVDEQASAPTPAPKPTASEEELALAWLRENPKLQPQTINLLQSRDFTLKRNGLVRGSTTMSAGASAKVEAWDDTTVTAGFAAEPRVLPHEATDFVARVVAVYRNDQKLDQTIIPAMSFTDWTVREVVEFLERESAVNESALTPVDSRGIKITLALDSYRTSLIVTMDLKNITLREALDYLTRLADLEFTVTGQGVSILPLSSTAPP